MSFQIFNLSAKSAKNPNKNQILRKIGIFSILSFILFISCEPETIVEKNWLKGYWKSNYGDGFEITSDEKQFKQYDDEDKTLSFSGEIVKIIEENDSKGRFIVKVTNSGTWGKTVGKYLAVSYKDLNNNVVKQATAGKFDSNLNPDPQNELSTPDEAENIHTEANGFFGIYGEYIRQ